MSLKRAVSILALALGFALLAAPTAALGHARHVAKPRFNLHGTVTGKVIGFKPAGMQPDFDLLDRVVMKTTLRRHFGPPMTLVLDAYLENFQWDTTPTLPDVINLKKTVSNGLGGFFSGQAIITDRRGTVLYQGLMLMEAFNFGLNGMPSKTTEVNHLTIRANGQGPAKGGVMNLDSVLVLHIAGKKNAKNFHVTGTTWGRSIIPAAATVALRRPGNGSGGLSLSQILNQFKIPRPAMKGRPHPKGPATNFCVFHNNACSDKKALANSQQNRVVGTNPRVLGFLPAEWTQPLGFVFLGCAGLLLIIFFWQQRNQPKKTPYVAHVSSSPDSDDK